MDPTIDWLDRHIELMHAGRSLRSAGPIEVGEMGEPGEMVAMLRMAARLNALRPGAADPAPGFLEGLRDRVLAACGEAGPGANRR